MLKRELVRGIVISNTCVKLYRNWIINEVARAGEHTNKRTYVLTYIRTGQTLYPLHNFVVRGDNKNVLSITQYFRRLENFLQWTKLKPNVPHLSAQFKMVGTIPFVQESIILPRKLSTPANQSQRNMASFCKENN